MGAVSADLPAIQLVTGPKSTGRYHGERLGACTDCRRFWARYRAGEIDDVQIAEVEQRLATTTAGICAVMGSASTMASIAEALGMMPAGSAVPAVDALRLRLAEETGRVAGGLIGSDLTFRAGSGANWKVG